MLQRVVSFFKKMSQVCNNPILWIVNLCGLIVGAWFWTGADSVNPDLTKAIVTCIGLLVMAVGSLCIFLLDDKEVRLYQKSLDKKKNKKKNKNIQDKSSKKNDDEAPKDAAVRAYLYAQYSLTKYKSGLNLAITWTLLWGAVVISAPCNQAPAGDYLSLVPKMLLVASFVVLVTTAYMKQLYTDRISEKWFGLATPPKKDVPAGFEKGVVLCKSPKKLANWGYQELYRCEISEIDGNKMPKDAKREDILWRYIPLENEP